MNINCFATDLLSHFFEKLNASKIKYVVLRNYDKLPLENVSKDVDILVKPKNIISSVLILKETAVSLNYKLVWVNKLDYLEGFVFVRLTENNVYSIKLDIFQGLKWKGCNYLDHDYILDNAEKYNNFYIPRKSHEAMIMIVYYILFAKIIRNKYLEQIYSNAINNWDEFKSVVERSFSKSLGEDILLCIKEGRVSDLSLFRRRVVKNVVVNNLSDVNILGRVVRHLFTESFVRNSFGTLLVFSGPDGAGKSTLVNAVSELFYLLGVNNEMLPHHLLTKNIPAIHKIRGVPGKYAKQDYTKPYQAVTAGFTSSLLRTVYYFFAFLVDRLIYIKKERRLNNIVIFDRYYTDVIADPVRLRIGLPRKIVKVLFNLLPSPECVFIVLANKDLIMERKDELTENKLVELLGKYSELTNKDKCIALNNNGSIAHGKYLVFNNVFNILEKRFS